MSHGTLDLSVREVILETLALAPSSVAALYGSASRLIGRAIGVTEFWFVTSKLVEERFVAYWLLQDGDFIPGEPMQIEDALHSYEQWLDSLPLGKLSVDELSVDPIGVWLTATESGVAEARRLAACDLPPWSIDVDYESRTLVVQAATLAIAREQAELFLKRQAMQVSHPAEDVEYLEGFDIQGYRVEHGVKLTLRY